MLLVVNSFGISFDGGVCGVVFVWLLGDFLGKEWVKCLELVGLVGEIFFFEYINIVSLLLKY